VEEDLALAIMDGRADDPRLTRREQAALEFADRFWHDHHAIDDELWAKLNDVFEPSELIELALSVAQNMAMGKVIAMLGVPNPDFRSAE
jgi:alkylhydroperoxidase family enzyme